MQKTQKIFIGIAIILILIIPLWIIIIVPEIEKLPDNFSEKIEYHGQISFLNLETNTLDKPISIIEEVLVETSQIANDWLYIKTNVKTINAHNEILWKSEFEYKIDRKSLEHLHEDNIGSYLRFPKHIKQQNYFLRDELFFSKGEMIFSGQENIQELEVFVFNYDIQPVDISFIYTNTPYIEKGTITSALKGKMWVEPITGKIIKRQHDWQDCYTGTNKCINIGNTFYNTDTIINQTRIANNQKNHIILIEIITPALLIILATALLVGAYIGRKK